MQNPSSPCRLQHADFSDEVAIACPKCTGKAPVKGPGLYHENVETLTYCVCIHCGYNQKYHEKKVDFIRANSNGKVFGHRVQLLSGDLDPFFTIPYGIGHLVWRVKSGLIM